MKNKTSHVFKFIITPPHTNPDSPGSYKMASIIMSAPQLCFKWDLGEGLPDVDKLKLAKAELKIQMIDALLNGEWEIEK